MSNQHMEKLHAICRRSPGLVSRIAEECGVTQGAVSQWFKKQVPARHVITVERMTGMPREEISPDVFGKARRQRRPKSSPLGDHRAGI